jgi:hypothetical protein
MSHWSKATLLEASVKKVVLLLLVGTFWSRGGDLRDIPIQCRNLQTKRLSLREAEGLSLSHMANQGHRGTEGQNPGL